MAVLGIAPEITSLLVIVHQKSSLGTLIDNSILIIYVDVFSWSNFSNSFYFLVLGKKSYLIVNIASHCFLED